MITISKRLGDNKDFETVSANMLVLNPSLYNQRLTNTPIYIESKISHFGENKTISVNAYETNLINTDNFKLRTYIKENGLKGLYLTSKPIASLSGEFANKDLIITSFNVDPDYYDLSLGNLILHTAEDIAYARQYQNINFDIAQILKVKKQQTKPQGVVNNVKNFISNKIDKIAIKSATTDLCDFLKTEKFDTSTQTPHRQIQAQQTLQPNVAQSTWTTEGEKLQVAYQTFNLDHIAGYSK